MAFVAQRVKDPGAIDYTPASNVAAGDIVVVGNLVGVAPVAIAAGTLGAVETCGTFRVATESATTFAIGDPVYFNATSKVATATGTDALIGFAVAVCGSGALTVDVYITPTVGEGAASSGS